MATKKFVSIEKLGLYDEKIKLWCTGPAYIAELYMEELKKLRYKM